MRMVISIEGSVSNTETNIFNELMLLARSLATKDNWIYKDFIILPLSLRKCGNETKIIDIFKNLFVNPKR